MHILINVFNGYVNDNLLLLSETFQNSETMKANCQML